MANNYIYGGQDANAAGDGVRNEEEIAHFLTLEALQQYHYRIFESGAQLHYIGGWCLHTRETLHG
jgi:hypothetical protein